MLTSLCWSGILGFGTAFILSAAVSLHPEASSASGLPHSSKVVEGSMSTNLHWQETETSLALFSGDKTVWQFNFEPSASKPYFQPISLLDGTSLTWARPPDHPWHLGLWFSWKYIDGLNYWEEDRETGLSEGRTTVTRMASSHTPEGSATLEMSLEYHPPDQPPVLREARTLRISSPDANGAYRIDWFSHFKEARGTGVLLDRTPIQTEPEGKTWGGYAGLSVRLAQGASDWAQFNSEGGQGIEQTSGVRARWVCYGLTTESGRPGSITFFDHSENPRHPSPWYVIGRTGTDFAYFSPALLYLEPMRLEAKASFELRYRVLVSPEVPTAQTLEHEFRTYTQTEE